MRDFERLISAGVAVLGRHGHLGRSVEKVEFEAIPRAALIARADGNCGGGSQPNAPCRAYLNP